MAILPSSLMRRTADFDHFELRRILSRALDAMQHLLDLMNDRRLNSLGGLVEHQQLGFCEQRPPDGELLLLPAR